MSPKLAQDTSLQSQESEQSLERTPAPACTAARHVETETARGKKGTYLQWENKSKSTSFSQKPYRTKRSNTFFEW